MGIVVVTDQKGALRFGVLIGLAIPVLGGLLILGNILILAIQEGTWGWLAVALIAAAVAWRVRKRAFRILAILAAMGFVATALFSAISSKGHLGSCIRLALSIPVKNGGKLELHEEVNRMYFYVVGGVRTPVGTGWEMFVSTAHASRLADCARRYPTLLSINPDPPIPFNWGR